MHILETKVTKKYQIWERKRFPKPETDPNRSYLHINYEGPARDFDTFWAHTPDRLAVAMATAEKMTEDSEKMWTEGHPSYYTMIKEYYVVEVETRVKVAVRIEGVDTPLYA